MLRWKILKKADVFKGRIFTLKNLSCFNEHKSTGHDFMVLETFNWVNIVAQTAGGSLIMVKQHRLGTDEVTVESVGGVIDPGEDPAEAAARELLEETGYECGSLVFMKKLAVNPAIMNNYTYFYYAGDCVKKTSQNLDPGEDIEIVLFEPDEVKRMLESGEINHSIVVNALNFFFIRGS